MAKDNTPRVSASERIAAWGYQLGWAAMKKIPEPVAKTLFNAIADVASKKGKGPEQLRRNLARVVGPENVTRELVRQSMRSYMRYWLEAFRLPSMVGPELIAKISENVAADVPTKIEASLAGGKGAIFALPHATNWDMAGVWLVHHSGEFTTVAERLRPESLFDAFVKYRRTLGFDVIALSGADKPPMAHMEQTLRENRVVCLMAERDLTGSGVHVDFFGERCSMPAGPALLAKRTGAPLHVVKMHYTHDGWLIELSDPLDTSQPLEDIVQQEADLMAEYIGQKPEDWHMLQPLWHADLSADRRRKMGLDDHSDADAEQGGR